MLAGVISIIRQNKLASLFVNHLEDIRLIEHFTYKNGPLSCLLYRYVIQYMLTLIIVYSIIHLINSLFYNSMFKKKVKKDQGVLNLD